jgi:hypothetical protein
MHIIPRRLTLARSLETRYNEAARGNSIYYMKTISCPRLKSLLVVAACRRHCKREEGENLTVHTHTQTSSHRHDWCRY